jgi:hypothetical protein
MEAEAGVVAEIGPGIIGLKTDQANAYVVGAGHNTALSILGLAPASSGCDDISGTEWNCHAEIANVEEAAPICREIRVLIDRTQRGRPQRLPVRLR